MFVVWASLFLEKICAQGFVLSRVSQPFFGEKLLGINVGWFGPKKGVRFLKDYSCKWYGMVCHSSLVSPFPCVLVLRCTYYFVCFRHLAGICHGYVPGTCSLQVMRDGMPQLVSTVSFRAGTAVHVLFCVLPSRRLFCRLVCDHGLMMWDDHQYTVTILWFRLGTRVYIYICIWWYGVGVG